MSETMQPAPEIKPLPNWQGWSIVIGGIFGISLFVAGVISVLDSYRFQKTAPFQTAALLTSTMGCFPLQPTSPTGYKSIPEITRQEQRSLYQIAAICKNDPSQLPAAAQAFVQGLQAKAVPLSDLRS